MVQFSNYVQHSSFSPSNKLHCRKIHKRTKFYLKCLRKKLEVIKKLTNAHSRKLPWVNLEQKFWCNLCSKKSFAVLVLEQQDQEYPKVSKNCHLVLPHPNSSLPDNLFPREHQSSEASWSNVIHYALLQCHSPSDPLCHQQKIGEVYQKLFWNLDFKAKFSLQKATYPSTSIKYCMLRKVINQSCLYDFIWCLVFRHKHKGKNH